ncbi:MAG: hypothetical protein ACXWBY_06955 [Kaistella sp.]
MNKLESAKHHLDRYYLDETEYLKLNPSYHLIESYSTALLEVINDLRNNPENELADLKFYEFWREADIFNADFSGELFDDYKKQNKRYRQNWLEQKKVIDGITSELYTYLNSVLNSDG